MVNPRDIAGERRKKERKNLLHQVQFISSHIIKYSWIPIPELKQVEHNTLCSQQIGWQACAKRPY